MRPVDVKSGLKAIDIREEILRDDPVVESLLKNGRYYLLMEIEWLVYRLTGLVSFPMKMGVLR